MKYKVGFLIDKKNSWIEKNIKEKSNLLRILNTQLILIYMTKNIF
tara:strand:- start:4544 stop:4678 length:135 start_codon:yes stop_codon:yes gene_type:complete